MTVSRSSPRWTLALTSLAFFMIVLDALVVATALPSIRRDLHASVSTLGWTVNAYNLTYAAGIITAAALGERLGRRRMFLAGLGIFTLSSAGCALAPSVGLLLAARVLQGVGAAAVMPLSLTLLTSAFPLERRGAMVGDLGRDRWPCGRQRPGRRRGDHPGHRLALDLLDQRPDRCRGDGIHAAADRREPRGRLAP